MSLFVWYFWTKRAYPEVAHHTILLGPRYKGLLEDIFDHQVLADDFSLYLRRPTATDPSLAPDGCDGFYVDRVYLVGAGTHPGAGLPGVLSSARILDRVVPDAFALT